MRRIASYIVTYVAFVILCHCQVATLPCRTEDPRCNSVTSALMLTAAMGIPTNRWLAVGTSGNVAYSQDVRTGWVFQDLGGDSLNAAAYGHAGYVAVGNNGRVVTSYDGSTGTWSEQLSGTSLDLLDVAYANGLYVAVGGTGTTSIILTSADGVIWTNRSLSLADRLLCVEFLNNAFAAVGEAGSRASSADGLTWNDVSAGANNWKSVAFGDSTYVITDDGGNVYTSTTFGTGSSLTYGSPSASLEVSLYMGSQSTFVLGGDGGTMYTSADGTSGTAGEVIVGVPWGIATDNTLVAVATESGTIEYSTDLSVYNPIVVGSETWQDISHDTVLVR